MSVEEGIDTFADNFDSIANLGDSYIELSDLDNLMESVSFAPNPNFENHLDLVSSTGEFANFLPPINRDVSIPDFNLVDELSNLLDVVSVYYEWTHPNSIQEAWQNLGRSDFDTYWSDYKNKFSDFVLGILDGSEEDLDFENFYYDNYSQLLGWAESVGVLDSCEEVFSKIFRVCRDDLVNRYMTGQLSFSNQKLLDQIKNQPREFPEVISLDVPDASDRTALCDALLACGTDYIQTGDHIDIDQPTLDIDKLAEHLASTQQFQTVSNAAPPKQVAARIDEQGLPVHGAINNFENEVTQAKTAAHEQQQAVSQSTPVKSR